MKVYIAGPITGVENFKESFDRAESVLREQGHTTLNPAILPPGFEHHEYMKICLSMVDVCDAVVLLPGWEDSKGARMEHSKALSDSKKIGVFETRKNKVEWTIFGGGK